MKETEYRYKTRDLAGFLSQIVRYVANGGHYYFIRCVVPEGKNPDDVAERLMAKYDIRKKRWQRKRRHLKETASIHYLAYERVFVIMLSKGKHESFYADHGAEVVNIGRLALKVFGYSIKYNREEDKVSVRLDEEKYREVRAHMLTICTWSTYRDAERLEREFHRLRYEPYGPVYEQLMSILRQVNRARRGRGFEQISPSCIRKFRRNAKVFVEPQEDRAEAA